MTDGAWDDSFNSAQNSDEETIKFTTIFPPTGKSMLQIDSPKIEKGVRPAPKKPSCQLLCISVVYFLFIMVAWPITELVFYSKYTQYCDVPASTEVVKLNPWILADGIMNLFLLIIIVTLFFLFCWICCCAFAIDLCCGSECVEFLGELSKLIAVKLTRISKSVYYRIFSILISFIMGAIGVFVSFWSFQHCQAPFPGIAVTATVVRIFSIFITIAMMFNVFDQCNE